VCVNRGANTMDKNSPRDEATAEPEDYHTVLLHKLWQQLVSENENTRHMAADALYRKVFINGRHPDDFTVVSREDDLVAQIIKLDNDLISREHADASGRDTMFQAYAALTAENAELREKAKPNRATRTKSDPEREVALCEHLDDTIFTLDRSGLQRRLRDLIERRGRRVQNLAAEIELPLGQYVEAVYRAYKDLFGGRKRGDSNMPTKTQFLAEIATGDPADDVSWLRRMHRAYRLVVSPQWPDIRERWDGRDGVRGILDAAGSRRRQETKAAPRATIQKRLNDLCEVVRKREWDMATVLVGDYDAENEAPPEAAS
jgi:hypothetical protein